MRTGRTGSFSFFGRLGFIAVLGFFLGLQELAASPLSWLDQVLGIKPKPLPSCFENFSRDALGTLLNLRLGFDVNEKYQRAIRVKLTVEPCKSSTVPRAIARSTWTVLAPGATDFIGKPFTTDQLETLRQLRAGGLKFKPAYLTPDYVVRRMVKSGVEYTLSVNRTLSRDYGYGYSAEVFKTWIKTQRRNLIARKAFSEEIQRQLFMTEGDAARSLVAKSKNVVVLVSMGLSWPDEIKADTKPYIADFITSMENLGMELKFLKREDLGEAKENVRILIPQIRRELAAGKDVILFGLCKGVPEVLLAASRVIGPYLDRDRKQTRLPQGYGRIRAAIQFSAMLGATYFAEPSNLNRMRAVKSLAKTGDAMGIGLLSDVKKNLDVLPSISPDRIREMRDELMRNLPSDIPYLSSVGVLPGNGLMPKYDPMDMAPIQKADRLFHLSQGASDGFIEYPGQLIDRSISNVTEELIFDGSHMLLDGSYENYALNSAPMRTALYRSFFHRVLDLAESPNLQLK